jgi:outer membrane lipoprotein-sorting protein
MTASNRARAGVLAAVVATAVVFAGVSAVRADSTPELPSVAPAQLLASTLDALAGPATISGTVSTRIDLGIPELPTNLGGGSLGPISSIAGDQRYKIWHSAAGVRVAHLLPFDEQDAVANATDAWFWDSRTMRALHVSVPTRTVRTQVTDATPSMGDLLRLAGNALSAVRPYADVSVSGTARVAGRPVYQLTLTPRSTLTRVGRIVVGIDSATRLPLRFQVFARGATEPTVESSFTTVSFGAIPSSMFVFAPPPGANVRQLDPATLRGGSWIRSAEGRIGTVPMGIPAILEVRTLGDGFDLRWALRLSSPPPPNVAAFLPYAGPLLSATVVDRDGTTWLLAGFVDLPTLEHDAGRLP